MTPLEVAIQEIGYTEYPAGSNKTKYGVWFGWNGVKWCMEFVQYCHFFSDFGGLPYKTASCSALLNWYKTNAPECIVKTPQPNDIVIYEAHTGIVERVSGSMMWVIEGNTSRTNDDNGGAVMRRTRQVKLAKAFIRPSLRKEGKSGKVTVTLDTIKKGSKGNQVKALQQMLMARGYDLGKAGADGDCGTMTVTAIKLFQRDNGLAVDGIAGQDTWATILGVK